MTNRSGMRQGVMRHSITRKACDAEASSSKAKTTENTSEDHSHERRVITHLTQGAQDILCPPIKYSIANLERDLGIPLGYATLLKHLLKRWNFSQQRA